MKEIKVKILCSACRKDCGDALFSINEHLQLCFNCVDIAKQKADEWRESEEEKEIAALSVVIERTFVNYDRSKATDLAKEIHSAGYRKLTDGGRNA